MLRDLTDDKSSLIQVMAWCHQATRHYLSHCWPRSMSPYGVTRPQWVKKLKLKNGSQTYRITQSIFDCTSSAVHTTIVTIDIYAQPSAVIYNTNITYLTNFKDASTLYVNHLIVSDLQEFHWYFFIETISYVYKQSDFRVVRMGKNKPNSIKSTSC